MFVDAFCKGRERSLREVNSSNAANDTNSDEAEPGVFVIERMNADYMKHEYFFKAGRLLHNGALLACSDSKAAQISSGPDGGPGVPSML
jgi:protein involved in sex pheromone biosynthesis